MRLFLRLFTGLWILMVSAPCYSTYSNPPDEEVIKVGIKSRFKAIKLDHICEFDSLLRIEAKKTGWDWRMLASIIYQESHFKPYLINEKGAFGLMQLMPVTMAKYGINYDSSVEDQLEVAGKLLLHFDRELPESISDSLVRGDFILACYNAGLGYILKARSRAEQHGKNPDIWINNVEHYVPKQTYYFVREIKKRYSNYKVLIE